jgi:PRTRC genetic system ThiF family protein
VANSTRKKAPAQPTAESAVLDTSLSRAKPVQVGQFDASTLWLIGCGGSGSWLAPAVARVARQMKERGQTPTVYFVDPDVVDPANVYRQAYCDGKVGANKAFSLAARYSQAWGIEITALQTRFSIELFNAHCRWYSLGLTVLIDCVDNAAGRQVMAEVLRRQENYLRGDAPPRIWCLDCGNGRTSGQVLLGNTFDGTRLQKAFVLPDRCNALPAPSLQYPDQLVPRPEERRGANQRMSCEQMALANAQSLTVNQMVAAIAADYLVGLTLSQQLKSFATYFDLGSMSMRSRYITAEALAAFAPAPRKSRKKP